MSISGSERPAPPSVDELLCRFLDEKRAGGEPDIDDYVSRYPERANELREVLSAARMMEDAGRPAGSMSSRVTADGRSIRQLGDYRILREVGRGGMGVVYEALQESLGRRVALKVLPFYAMLDKKRVQRFRAEAKAVGSLQHPHIVAVYAVGEEGGIHYHAMQYIEGQPLHEVLREVRRLRESLVTEEAGRLLRSGDSAGSTSGAEGTASMLSASRVTRAVEDRRPQSSDGDRPSPDPVSHGLTSSGSSLAPSVSSSSLLTESKSRAAPRTYYHTAARIALHVAEALAYAHDQGILHRDIKPANLLLDNDGHVWVTDFGLAKAKDREELTQTGDVVGTLAYMAPESLEGWTDPRSEVYSLGVTLYEILTLRPAFRDSSRRQLLKKIATVLPPAPRRIDPKIPIDLETVVLRAIEKDPNQRYRSAAELASDLQAFLEDRPVEARRSTVPERLWRWCRRNPLIATTSAAAIGCFLLAVVGLVVALWLRNERNDADYWRNLAEAREYRASIEPGRKVASRERVRRAAELLGDLWLDDGERDARILQLRRELVAGAAQVDLRGARILPGVDTSGAPKIAFGSDYLIYARRERDGKLYVRRLVDRSVIASFATPSADSGRVKFSPRDRFLMARFNDGEQSLLVWDLESGREKVHAKHIVDNAVAVSADEKLLALAVRRPGEGIRLCLQNLEDGTAPRLLSDVEDLDTVYMLAFHPRADQLAVSGGHVVRILNLDDGREIGELEHDCRIRGIAWQPGGKLIAAAGSDFKVHVWNLSTGLKQTECKGHSGEVIHVSFHPGGNLLASRSWDGTFRLWEPYSGTQRVRLTQRSIDPTLHFSNDGKYLTASVLPEEGVWLWQVVVGDSLKAVHGHHRGGKSPRSVAYSPDGRWFATCGDDGIGLWESGTGKELGCIEVPHVMSVLPHPDGDELIVSSRHRLLRFELRRQTERGRVRLSAGAGELLFPSTSGGIDCAALDRRGRYLAVIHAGHVDVLDLDEQCHRVSLSGHGNLAFVDIHPDGRLVATGSWQGKDVMVWDPATGERVVTLPPKDSANVRFSPDGELLVVSERSRYRTWEVGSWRERFSVERNRYNVPVPAAWTPDGRFLAVTDSPEVVLLIDCHTGREIIRVEPPVLHDVSWLDFSPDGSCLAVATTNQLVWEWNLSKLAEDLTSVGLAWEGVPAGEIRDGGEIEFETAPRIPDLGEDLKNAERYYCGYQRIAQALKKDPNDSDALRAREQTLRKWTPLAVDRLLRAIFDLQAAGLNDEVFRAYEALLQLDLDARQRAYHQNNLAWLYVTGPQPFRDPERGIAIAREALSNDPENRYVRNTLGVAYYRAGRYDEASRALEASLAKGTDDPVYDWLFLSMCHSRRKDFESARETLRKAVEWLAEREDLGPEVERELAGFRAEAEGLLGGPGHTSDPVEQTP